VDNTTTGEVDDTGVGQTQSRAYAALRLRRGSFVLNDASTALHDTLLDTGVRDKHGAELQPQGEGEEVEIWPGDVFQVGGVFVMGPGNTCDYVFRSEYAGDHPSLPDVVQAATGKTLTGEDYLYVGYSYSREATIGRKERGERPMRRDTLGEKLVLRLYLVCCTYVPVRVRW
jgi:hypothetical protein